MRIYTIKKLLNIQEHKATEIISATPKEIHVRLEAYRRKKTIHSGCEDVHEVGYLKRLCEINQPIYPRLWRGLKRASSRFILMTT